MNKLSTELRAMLRLDILNAGRAPAIGIVLGAIIVFFYKFQCVTFGKAIQLCCVLIIFIQIFRLAFTRRLNKLAVISDSNWRAFRFLIVTSSFFVTIMFTLASIELNFQGIHFIVLTAILCGFTSSSIITIGADLKLYVIVQSLVIITPCLILIIDTFTENRFRADALVLFYSMYFFYQMYQVSDYRSKAIKYFQSQLDLNRINADLKLSQEMQIEQSVKLIHTSRLAALGEMAGGIAHEINNPLAIISGSMQQIERELPNMQTSSAVAVKKQADRSLSAIERITRIVNGLRQFSQQSDIQPKKVVPLNAIMDDTLHFCEELLKARYINLKIDKIPDVQVKCHPVQISQVLINLIKNAEDAISEVEGEIHKWIKLKFEQENGKVQIFVSNGGPKISDSIVEKLFLPFFTTKPVGKGTGLGLSISQGILKEHGGDLFFDESKDQTTFCILLPSVS